MLAVVQADGDELADAADAGTNAYRLFDERQGFKIQLANLVESRWRQGLAGDVVDDALTRLRMWPAESRMPGSSLPAGP